MLNDIIHDPIKLPMLVILVVLEVPALIYLIVEWIKANRRTDHEQNTLGGACEDLHQCSDYLR